jgi:hypothetical protein
MTFSVDPYLNVYETSSDPKSLSETQNDDSQGLGYIIRGWGDGNKG